MFDNFMLNIKYGVHDGLETYRNPFSHYQFHLNIAHNNEKHA